MEEGDQIWRKLDRRPRKKQAHGEPSTIQAGKSNLPSRQDTKSKVIDKNNKYTPLLTSRAKIQIEIEDEQYLCKPPILKSLSANQDKSKYYQFYYDYNHDTEQCYHLKEIEDIIQHGYLRKYVHGGAQTNP